MTGTRDPQQDGSIQAMLRDSGLEASTELRSSLEELRTLAPDRAPAPRADLAALLDAGARVTGAPTTAVLPAVPVTAAESAAGEPLPAGVTGLAGRRSRKRRLAMVGGVVVGAMALGAGAVAASSEDFRLGVGHAVGVIFQPSGRTSAPAPEPAKPSPADIPAAPVPATAPAPATSGPPAVATPGEPAPPATPPAVGRGRVLPAPGQRPVDPEVPPVPGFPSQGQGLPPLPVVPVTPTVPGQP